MTVDNVKVLAEDTRKAEYCSFFCKDGDCKGFGKCPVHGSEWCEEDVYAQGFVDGFFKFWSMWDKHRQNSEKIGEEFRAFREKLENKQKTYILMLSKYFPVTHPQAGEPTFFRDKVLAAVLGNHNAWQKLHTIRANYPLWAKRIEEVQRGLAIISLRQWSGKPYRSKTLEITRLDYHDNVGIQKLTFDKDRDGMVSWNFFNVDGKHPEIEDLAHNDGLLLDDWKAWFKDYDFTKPMAVIQFTKYRY